MFNSKFNNLTILIVTYKSQKVIFKTLKNLKTLKNIFILDNSNDIQLKNKIKQKYKNINFFLSSKNLGYAGGNNLLLRKVKTDYVLILNPDCLVSASEILRTYKLMLNLKNLNSKCAIIGSDVEAEIVRNLKLLKKYPVCKYVKGFFMLCDFKVLKKVKFFDEKFFLYLEEIDLCKRVIQAGYKIIAFKNLKIKHLAGKSSSDRAEYIKLQTWHWMWSKFYYSCKTKGNLISYFIFFHELMLIFFKKIFFRNKKKYNLKFQGLWNSMIKKQSFYRG